MEATETETVIDLLQALQTERRQLNEKRRLEDKELDGKFSECFARLKLVCKPNSDYLVFLFQAWSFFFKLLPAVCEKQAYKKLCFVFGFPYKL